MSKKFNQPFSEQVNFFKSKLAIPSDRFDDLMGAEHDHGFMVAGATKADLVNDLFNTMAKYIEEGKSIDSFRRDFDNITAKHGWTGWTGSDSKGGVAWRTKTIYKTNMQTSYAAGRYQQMTDPDVLAARPYWRYVHTSVNNPRAEHQQWHGLVLPADDPWWQTHMPPNGYGCNCQVETLSESDLKKLGKDAPDTAPTGKQKLHTNVNTGEQTLIPDGITQGFDYQPGRSATEVALAAARQKVEKLNTFVARKNIEALIKSDAFVKFFKGEIKNSKSEFPIAVLKENAQLAIQAESPVVLLSQESLTTHTIKHPEIGISDYQKIQKLIDNSSAEIWLQGNDGERLAYLIVDEIRYRAVLKRTKDGGKNYFLTLFRDSQKYTSEHPFAGRQIQ